MARNLPKASQIEGSPEEESSESPKKEAAEQKSSKMGNARKIMKAVTDRVVKGPKKPKMAKKAVKAPSKPTDEDQPE